jgi:hypothetical protein
MLLFDSQEALMKFSKPIVTNSKRRLDHDLSGGVNVSGFAVSHKTE